MCMTRVLYDLAATQGYKTTKFHGGGEYAKRVFFDCAGNTPAGTVLEAHLESSRFTDPAVVQFARERSITLHYIDSAAALESLLADGQYDRYYSALPTDAGWNYAIPPDTRFIFTLHGVRGLLVQDWRLRSKYGKNFLHGFAMETFFLLFGRLRYGHIKREVARKVACTSNRTIVTVSNYGRFSYTAALPKTDFSDMKVLDSVTEENPPERDSSILTKNGLESGRYLLMVSANRYEKNGFRALRAIDQFFTDVGDRKAYDGIRVAITGIQPDSRLARLLRLKNRSRFEFLSYVSPGEMEELYASAQALVYPSISEGYGYPPVLAMRYDTPSICAGGTSIPEICGDAALYFNPYDPEEIMARLYEVLDPVVLSQLTPRLQPRAEMLFERQRFALSELRRLIVGIDAPE